MVSKMIKPVIKSASFLISNNDEWLCFVMMKSEIYVEGFTDFMEWFEMKYIEREQDIIFWLNEI